MALPILDGNQSPATLATTISGGAHYPNHIIASAVTISSLPAISGTVTIGSGTAQIGSVTASISGTIPISISSVTIGNFPATQPISIASVTIGSALPAGTNRIGVVTIGGGTVTIGSGTAQIGSVTASIQAGTAQIGSVTASISGTVPISISSVTIGNSVTISSLPAISGTVTANGSRTFVDNNAVTVSGFMSVGGWDAVNSIHAPLPLTDSATGLYVACDTSSGPFVISGTVTANVKFAADVGETMPPQAIALGFYSSDDAGIAAVNDVNRKLPISGTVTANLPALNYNTVKISFAEKSYYNGIYKKGSSGYVNQDGGGIPVYSSIDEKFHGGLNPVLTRSIQTGSGATFSGTRWNFQSDAEVEFYAATTAADLRLVTQWYNSSGQVSVSITPYSVEPVAITNSVTIGSLPVSLSTTSIGGTARLNVTLSSATTIGATAPSYGNLYGGSDGTNLRAISVDTSGRTVVTGSVSVASTTVTISAQPSGALTTRFGSLTTANTSQITTAVTNTSRKYLLAQNISTGTVTIGIGFSPTTTQGIQLTAGAGLTFDSFVPTGAVYWLGATTGAAYTILEG